MDNKVIIKYITHTLIYVDNNYNTVEITIIIRKKCI